MKLSRDEALGLGLIVAAAAYWAAADQIPVSLLADEVGADGAPKMLAIALATLGALLVAMTRFRPVPAGAAQNDSTHRGSRVHFRAAGLLVGLALYILLLPFLGYPLAIALLIGSAAIYGGTPARPRVALVSALAGIGFWVIFAKVLGVSMPLGSWLPVS